MDSVCVWGRAWPEVAQKSAEKDVDPWQEKGGVTPGFSDHGRGAKKLTKWRIEKPQDFRRVCFLLMGEATTAFQNHYGYFWSRRRQSTSVNGVCQAQTTTSSISLGEGGIKGRNSRIFAVENCGKPRPSRVSEWPEQGKGCVGSICSGLLRHDLRERSLSHRMRLRLGVLGDKAQGWCSFGGWVWELWRTRRRVRTAMALALPCW